MIKKLWILIIPLIILSPGCKKNRDIVKTIDGAPVLISPENHSIVSENPPTLMWQTVNKNRHYEILLSPDENTVEGLSRFIRMISVSYGTTTVSHTYDFVLPPGVYTWQVRWVKDIYT